MKKMITIILVMFSGLFFSYQSISATPETFEIKFHSYRQLVNETDVNFTKVIHLSEDDIYQGNLLLVNNDYSVRPESIKDDLVQLSTRGDLVEGYRLQNQEILLSGVVARAFSKMVKAANETGVNDFVMNSGYRSLEEQNRLYLLMGSDYALPPGKSEHNLGLSLDVGSLQGKMEFAPEGKWIEENAWKYGFILRYPKEKVAITGIQYEPWHIRYVGLPHSAIMYEKDLVLEEYMDYLKKNKQIYWKHGGAEYSITYYPVTSNIEIHIPNFLQYEISGNNVDGVIITKFF